MFSHGSRAQHTAADTERERAAAAESKQHIKQRERESAESNREQAAHTDRAAA